MKVQITMRKCNGTLIPASRHSQNILDKVCERKDMIVTVHQARNPQHHDKFWAVATLVADNDEHFKIADDAVMWAKLKTSWMVRTWRLEDGTIIVEPKSISFASLDQLTFEKFYDQAMTLWSGRLGIDVETLKIEAAEA